MLMWLKTIFGRHIIEDVPNELAACEFECRVGECSQGEWKQCKRRILYSGQQDSNKKNLKTVRRA
jgi:hypothetical protein